MSRPVCDKCGEPSRSLADFMGSRYCRRCRRRYREQFGRKVAFVDGVWVSWPNVSRPVTLQPQELRP